MQLNHDQLHKLLDLIGESDIQELKLEGDDFRLEVRRNLPGAAPVAVLQAPAAGVGATPAAMALTTIPAAPSAPPPAAAARLIDMVYIKEPMLATFYISSAPGEYTFVEVLVRIKVGQHICIL